MRNAQQGQILARFIKLLQKDQDEFSYTKSKGKQNKWNYNFSIDTYSKLSFNMYSCIKADLDFDKGSVIFFKKKPYNHCDGDRIENFRYFIVEKFFKTKLLKYKNARLLKNGTIKFTIKQIQSILKGE